jgi:hypothetical protein
MLRSLLFGVLGQYADRYRSILLADTGSDIDKPLIAVIVLHESRA